MIFGQGVTRSLQGTAKHSTQGTSLSDITALMRTKRAINSSKKYIWATARFFTYDNPFLMTKEQFIGDTLSRSHAPKSSDGNYREFLSELEKAFDEFVTDGHVTVLYQTVCYLGTL